MSQTVEDEHHFLSQCLLYDGEIQVLLKVITDIVPLFLITRHYKVHCDYANKPLKVMKALLNVMFTCPRREDLVQHYLTIKHSMMEIKQDASKCV